MGLPRWHPDRLTFVACADGAGEQLYVVGDAGLQPVRGRRDVADLLRACPSATLEEAVLSCGLGPQLASTEGLRLRAPIRPDEVWAAGVTYERSRDARMLEAPGHRSAYDVIYDADRPELFLKSTARRLRGPGDEIGIRTDSAWQVPEPELGVVISDSGTVVGYVLGNDLSCRDIEGENPLYLPQAKIFNGSCSLGPAVVSAATVDYRDLTIDLRVRRDGTTIVDDSVAVRRLKRTPQDLARWLIMDNAVPAGTVLLTGTGIVPADDFSLQDGDEVEIHSDVLGTLSNRCVSAGRVEAVGDSSRG